MTPLGGSIVIRSRLQQPARRVWLGLWLALLAATPAAVTPADAALFKPSQQDQIKLGDQASRDVMRKYRVINDSRARRVEDVGNRLVSALSPKDRGPWNYRFYLIDSKEVNAFALPGGNMFIFTGLYDRLKSEDELAAVMGHEMTHVRKEHWANAAAKQQERQAGLLVILGITRAGRGWQNVAGLADSLISLKYSRSEEDQADDLGLQDMVAAGYNPRGMLDLFHTLQSAGGGGGGPAFLADHPLTKQRIDRTEDRIDKLGSRDFGPMTPLTR
jgi:predicted Zn-dependent protease